MNDRLSIEEHKANIDWMEDDPEAADAALHEMLCIAYPTIEAQSN